MYWVGFPSVLLAELLERSLDGDRLPKSCVQARRRPRLGLRAGRRRAPRPSAAWTGKPRSRLRPALRRETSDQHDHHEPSRPEPQELRAEQADHAPTSWSSPVSSRKACSRLPSSGWRSDGYRSRPRERTRDPLGLRRAGRRRGAVAVDAGGDAGVGEREPARLEVGDAHDDAGRCDRRRGRRGPTPPRRGGRERRSRPDPPSAGPPRGCGWTRTRCGPPRPRLRSRPRTSTIPAGSRPLAGSSRISSDGILQQRGGDAEPLLHPERVGADHVARRGP